MLQYKMNPYSIPVRTKSAPLIKDSLNGSRCGLSSGSFVAVIIAIGNKNDCPSRKVVVTEDAQRFASQMNIPLFETSAKENINVEEMFLTITKMVLRSKLEMKERQNVTSNDIVNIKKTHKTKKKCC
ncbi:Zinc finger protein [Operophtera brumata]|uniref:Zinc finger protein n=1 Tax=Operophtera brumata TaxID=104452 RepID=A0A0L7L361_OPEBR|nr:Zinc finger protein [Operophtera brumata]